MNSLTNARLASNVLLVAAAATVLVSSIFAGSIKPNFLLAMGAVAVLAGLGQFVVSIIRPNAIKPAWDEQTVASHKASYQFGYWSALIGFWMCLAMNHWFGLDLSAAFLWLGVLLISVPSIWMIVATLSGRAG